MVDRMIKCATATFHFPRSAPPKVVVNMSAPPVGINLSVDDFTYFTAVENSLEIPNRVAKTVLRHC
jgi:hypothetical protein